VPNSSMIQEGYITSVLAKRMNSANKLIASSFVNTSYGQVPSQQLEELQQEISQIYYILVVVTALLIVILVILLAMLLRNPEKTVPKTRRRIR